MDSCRAKFCWLLRLCDRRISKRHACFVWDVLVLADYARKNNPYDISGQHLVCADHISRKAQGWRTKHGFLQGQILLATQIMR